MTTKDMMAGLPVRQPLTMTTVEIASLTGKRHDNVLRDADKMLKELHLEDLLKFEGVYLGGNGEERRCLKLPKRETMILVSGYSVELRARIIDRWMELEGATVRPMSPAEILIAQGQAMLVLETEQAALAAKQIEQDAKIAETERRLNQIETASDWFTCIGYARWAKGESINNGDASRLGRRATKRCKELGVEPGTVPDPRFGIVYQYPKAILDTVWEELFGMAQ